MKIIDKNKDYWDYQTHIYGDDPEPLYDRRGSIKFTQSELIIRLLPYWGDDEYERKMKKSPVGKRETFNIKPGPYFYRDKYEFGVIIGLNIYIFHVLQVFITCEGWLHQWPIDYAFDGNIELRGRFSLKKDLGYKPIHLVKAYVYKYDAWNYRWFSSENNDVIEYPDEKMNIVIDKKSNFNCKNPVLAETKIPALIPAEEVYKELDNYLRSLHNDKDQQSAGLTDVDKAVNHGFDKKFSFRHPVKL
jgi:hypothetical protein